MVDNGGGLAELTAYAQARGRLQMIQRVVSGITAEAGRSLRAFHAMGELKDARELNDFLQLTANTSMEGLKREAKGLSQLNDPATVSAAVAKLIGLLGKTWLREVYVNSLLSGPFTQIVNIVGNMSVAMTTPVSTTVAATISAVVDPLRGRARV